MKSLVAFLFFLLVSFSQAKEYCLATTSFIADIAQNIAGNEVEVVSFLPLGSDPHIYDPNPSDSKKIYDAKLILKNGLNLEGWLEKLIQNSGTKATIKTISIGVNAIQDEKHANSYDPHAWMSVQNGIIYSENILAALSEAYPEKSTIFQANFNKYVERLKALDDYIFKQILKIPEGKRVLITSHDAFRYYGNRYGLKVLSILGTSTDAEVRTADILNIAKLIDSAHISAIFIESTINPRLMQQLAKDRKIKIGGKLFADSLGPKGSKANTYEEMLKNNTDVIVSALIGETILEEMTFLQNSFFYIILLFFALAFFILFFSVNKKSKEFTEENFELKVDDLAVSYDGKLVFSHIHLALQSGFVYGIVGPNGSGKSTLVKSILNLIKTDSGEILINGNPIKNYQNHIAYLPQKEETDWQFPVRVKDVVNMGRYPHMHTFTQIGKKDRASVNKAILETGIDGLKNKQISSLSGGQQQRTFIARALAQEAKIYILDEPFVGVDATTEKKIIELLKDLASKGKLVLVIHHDLTKVNEYFERLILINRRIVAVGETEETFSKENISKTFSMPFFTIEKEYKQKE